jgi:predicted metal-binding membrane protein
MALLFVLGVMNLLWVAFLAVVVLVEKVASRPEIVTRTLGVALIVWGSTLMLSGVW